MPEWIKMEAVHFMRMICTIYKSLLTCLQTKWKETNHGRYLFDELYSKILKKITAMKIDDFNDVNNRKVDVNNRKVWQHLYSQVAKEI